MSLSLASILCPFPSSRYFLLSISSPFLNTSDLLFICIPEWIFRNPKRIKFVPWKWRLINDGTKCKVLEVVQPHPACLTVFLISQPLSGQSASPNLASSLFVNCISLCASGCYTYCISFAWLTPLSLRTDATSSEGHSLNPPFQTISFLASLMAHSTCATRELKLFELLFKENFVWENCGGIFTVELLL